MDYIVHGGYKLNGELPVYGAKNSALALLGASVLTDEKIVLTNCPPIVDVQNMLSLLQKMGKKVWQVGDVVCVHGSVTNCDIPQTASLLRGSVLVLGGMLARYGTIKLPLPGGCDIGARPIDIHLDGLSKMGVEWRLEENAVICKGMPRAVKYKLRFPSVGATQNLICASVFCKGQTILQNCAIEPEVVQLQKALQSMGAKISGVGCKTVVITGVEKLHTAVVEVIPDRIVCATYLAGCVCAGGNLTVTNCNPKHLRSFLQLLENKFVLKKYSNAISICVQDQPNGYGQVATAPYPSFPTDMQSLLLSMACCCEGITTITENLFENRLSKNAAELTKMGATVKVCQNVATVVGGRLNAATVLAHDLRGGAGLVCAALSAKGSSNIGGIVHIDRGYLNLAQNLNSVGAKITIKD